jgi:hypothetical protein
MADEEEGTCSCIPPEIDARWATMTPDERYPYVVRHMDHVMKEVLAPSAFSKWLTREKV